MASDFTNVSVCSCSGGRRMQPCDLWRQKKNKINRKDAIWGSCACAIVASAPLICTWPEWQLPKVLIYTLGSWCAAETGDYRDSEEETGRRAAPGVCQYQSFAVCPRTAAPVVTVSTAGQWGKWWREGSREMSAPPRWTQTGFALSPLTIQLTLQNQPVFCLFGKGRVIGRWGPLTRQTLPECWIREDESFWSFWWWKAPHCCKRISWRIHYADYNSTPAGKTYFKQTNNCGCKHGYAT